MSDAKERNPAGQALFHMQFALLMIGVGRTDEASAAFEKAQAVLVALEKELDA